MDKLFKYLNDLLNRSPDFRIVAVGIMLILAAWCLTGCNKKAPEPVPATNLSDECYRSDRVKSCKVTLEIEFKEEK